MQLENEYGSYGDDPVYKQFMKDVCYCHYLSFSSAKQEIVSDVYNGGMANISGLSTNRYHIHKYDDGILLLKFPLKPIHYL